MDFQSGKELEMNRCGTNDGGCFNGPMYLGNYLREIDLRGMFLTDSRTFRPAESSLSPLVLLERMLNCCNSVIPDVIATMAVMGTEMLFSLQGNRGG